MLSRFLHHYFIKGMICVGNSNCIKINMIPMGSMKYQLFRQIEIYPTVITTPSCCPLSPIQSNNTIHKK